MKLPFVSRATYELGLEAGKGALHEAQLHIATLTAELAGARELLKDERRRHDETRALLADAGRRAFKIAAQVTAPRPVTVAQPQTTFNEFPPIVASALAVATAGFKPDDQRRIYMWAQDELANKVDPDEVARLLRNGLPVKIDVEELQ